MTDLIPRDAALSFVNSKVTNSGYSILGIRIEQGINAIPAIDPAAMELPEVKALKEALRALLQAICGPTGFAEAVRLNSGLAYPWPALENAELQSRSALAAIKDQSK